MIVKLRKNPLVPNDIALERAPLTKRRRGRPAGRTSADGVTVGREQLLAAAELQIRQSGANVSLEAIAARAGVTKPTLYKGVGDKDALVNALAERLALRIGQSVDTLVANSNGPRDGLRNFVEGYLKLVSKDREIYLFVTAGSGPDKVQQSLALADGTAKELAASMSKYRASQGADPDVSLVWSYGLLGALHFVTLWWLREPEGDVDMVIEQIYALFWTGMRLETADA